MVYKIWFNPRWANSFFWIEFPTSSECICFDFIMINLLKKKNSYVKSLNCFLVVSHFCVHEDRDWIIYDFYWLSLSISFSSLQWLFLFSLFLLFGWFLPPLSLGSSIWLLLSQLVIVFDCFSPMILPLLIGSSVLLLLFLSLLLVFLFGYSYPYCLFYLLLSLFILPLLIDSFVWLLLSVIGFLFGYSSLYWLFYLVWFGLYWFGFIKFDLVYFNMIGSNWFGSD